MSPLYYAVVIGQYRVNITYDMLPTFDTPEAAFEYGERTVEELNAKNRAVWAKIMPLVTPPPYRFEVLTFRR